MNISMVGQRLADFNRQRKVLECESRRVNAG